MALDLAIIGGGPAALSAALYAARAGVSVKVFVGDKIGGALTEIEHIANYPGYEGAGAGLAKKLQLQAGEAGASIQYGTCTSIKQSASGFTLIVDDESILATKVIIATGSEPRPLNISISKPVSYCALCDGALVQGKNIVVIGGGNSALQEAIYLSGLAKSVTVVSHSPFRADQCLLSAASQLQNLHLEPPCEPDAKYLNGFDYVFVFIGKRPATEFLPNNILNESGYIITRESSHETSIAGLFAAGDVRAGAIRQAITAAADGAAAAIEATAV